MKLNAGIITEKLAESKAFYTQVLQFGVTFENDFYLLLLLVFDPFIIYLNFKRLKILSSSLIR